MNSNNALSHTINVRTPPQTLQDAFSLGLGFNTSSLVARN